MAVQATFHLNRIKHMEVTLSKRTSIRRCITSHAKAQSQFCMQSGPGTFMGWLSSIASWTMVLEKYESGGLKYLAVWSIVLGNGLCLMSVRPHSAVAIYVSSNSVFSLW